VGGCRSKSCHGYLRALLKACGSWLVASPGTSAYFIRHYPQAHLLAMSLITFGQKHHGSHLQKARKEEVENVKAPGGRIRLLWQK